MLDWNDLKTFAAVARAGSLNAAAPTLGLHPTTVARRITSAEAALGAPLFLRSSQRSALTPAGRLLLERLGPLVDTVDDIARTTSPVVRQPVRVATTENGARVFVTRVLPALAAAGIDAEVVVGNGVVDLSRGEADFALRLVVPDDDDLVRRRIGLVSYGLYAATAAAVASDVDVNTQRVVMPSGLLKDGPEGRFLREHAPRAEVALRANSHVTLAQAAEAGAGLAVLPTSIGFFHPGLRLVRELEQIPKRALWLVLHRSQQTNRVVQRAAKIAVEQHARFDDELASSLKPKSSKEASREASKTRLRR